jgi:hypothetical protein
MLIRSVPRGQHEDGSHGRGGAGCGCEDRTRLYRLRSLLSPISFQLVRPRKMLSMSHGQYRQSSIAKPQMSPVP